MIVLLYWFLVTGMGLDLEDNLKDKFLEKVGNIPDIYVVGKNQVQQNLVP